MQNDSDMLGRRTKGQPRGEAQLAAGRERAKVLYMKMESKKVEITHAEYG